MPDIYTVPALKKENFPYCVESISRKLFSTTPEQWESNIATTYGGAFFSQPYLWIFSTYQFCFPSKDLLENFKRALDNYRINNDPADGLVEKVVIGAKDVLNDAVDSAFDVVSSAGGKAAETLDDILKRVLGIDLKTFTRILIIIGAVILSIYLFNIFRSFKK